MATVNLKPDGDITANWDTSTGANHYGEIDEGSPYTDAEYVETTTLDDVDEYTLEAVPENTGEVTEVAVNYRGVITDSGATAYVRLELFHSAGTPVTGNPKDVSVTDLGGTGVTATIVKTWTGLTLTRAEANTLQVRQTFKGS